MGVSQRSRCTGISRRAFVRTALIGGASLAMGTRTAAFARKAGSAGVPWVEATIPELQGLMDAGELNSMALTKGYLKRIDRLNPLLGAVIETNPQAIGIAARRDAERRRGIIRGPLHGIPVLVKDNIATDDRMETTAGSLALVGSRVPRDSVVVARLRRAGAVLLGKANLSEWASFRGFAPGYGWSARGGFTFNPYLLSFDPCGSSAGSAVATAANMCAVAVGTETVNSIVCPAGNNLIAGIKPTVGLVSQSGIIPIAHSQDTAGPMTRTVSDAALLLNVLRSPWGRVHGHRVPHDYRRFLDPDALQGARIGIDRRQFELFLTTDIAAAVDEALDAIADAGAEIIDPVDPGDPFAFFEAENLVLTNEFKGDVAAYMAQLRHSDMRTLSDLIGFNREHCDDEMRFFGQEIFELADSRSGDLHDPEYRAARARCLKFGRDQGIDAALANHHLDAILAPSYTFNLSSAVAGYPVISVPVGLSELGRPAGIWLSGGFLSEPTLIALAYAIEQLLAARVRPRFAGEVPPEPPLAGICESLESSAEQMPRMREMVAWMAFAGHAHSSSEPSTPIPSEEPSRRLLGPAFEALTKPVTHSMS
jgi:amidase